MAKGTRPVHSQITLLQTQWTEMDGTPLDKEIRKLWQEMELGNDHYVFWTNSDEMKEDPEYGVDEFWEKYPVICQYVKDNNIEGQIAIYFWW